MRGVKREFFPPVMMHFDSDREFFEFLENTGMPLGKFSGSEAVCFLVKDDKGSIKIPQNPSSSIESSRGKDGWVLIKGNRGDLFSLFSDEKTPQIALMRRALTGSHPPPMKIGKREFHFGKTTYIMGVVNVTPDSFYSSSRADSVEKAIEKALSLVEEGADIIDIGGESTRPGASPVPPEEEIKRVIPVLKKLRRLTDIPISVDTYKSRVALAAIEEGADMINDISGLRFDRKMIDVIKKFKIPIVLMHTSGRPAVMQKKTGYKWLLGEISNYLWGSLKKLGNELEHLAVLDPGIGFGKTPEANLYILKHLEFLKIYGRPIMVGVSRKSFIGYFGGGEKPEDRLEGSLVASAFASYRGADFVRVHDVKETKKALSIIHALKGLKENQCF